MKLALVVGTRPEIIKMAPVVRACERRGLPYVLLHTGQHYSFEMDEVFFHELELPSPHHNLEVGSGSPAEQVGTIISGMDRLIRSERPDVMLVEGDTNSVLGAAIAANKLGVAVGHVEAGLRSADRGMPEEINRILTDHIADHLYAPTQASRANLLAEGIPEARIHVTGNSVVDELLLQRRRAERPELFERFGVRPRQYALATIHRAENTDDPTRLRGIFAGISRAGRELGIEVLAALHPRTVDRLEKLGHQVDDGIRVLPPLSYLDFLGLHVAAAIVLTDSGGLQEEACTLQVPCVTLRDNTERPESVEVGANVLAGADTDRIVAAAKQMHSRVRDWPNPFGDGRTGERIVDLLVGG